MPSLLITLAWVVIILRCGFRLFNLLQKGSKNWLEIAFQLAIIIIALAFLL